MPDPVFDNVQHVWHLEEASGVREDSVGSLDLTPRDIDTGRDTGIHGFGAAFISDETIALQSAQTILPAEYSVAVWFNPSTTNPGPFGIFSQDGDDVEACFAIDGDTVTWQNGASALTVGHVSTGVWHLLVGTFDGSTQKASLDGAAFVSSAGTASNQNRDFVVGDTQLIGTADPGGVIDEVMFWNIVLTQEQVTTLWNGGAGTFYSPDVPDVPPVPEPFSLKDAWNNYQPGLISEAVIYPLQTIVD